MNDRANRQPSSSLVRTLGLVDVTMIVIGSMIGSGIFITSAESSRLSGAPGWLLLAWALAGLLTITGALCCSELATMMPRAGGVYVFLREAYGRSIGFLYGWTLFLVIQTGTIAAVAIAFAKFLGVFVPSVSPDHYLVAPISFGGYAISLSTEQLVAIALIALLTWSNTRGLEVGKIIQNTFTFAKTAALAAVVVIGLSLGWNANSAALSSAWWDSWANGWDPQSAQPGLRGCGIVVVLYLLANLAYLAVLPLTEIEHAPQNRVAVAMLNAVFGHPGAMCMAAAIMISTFGCDNGLILAGARVYYAMARDRLFFQKIATTNRFRVPAAALVAQGIWTALLTLPRTVTINAATHEVTYGNVYNQLLEYIVSADLLFYVLMIAALMVLRHKRPTAERPYRTWGYPFVPIISILLAGLLMVDLAFLAPATSGIGMLLVLTGVPVYFFWRKAAVA